MQLTSRNLKKPDLTDQVLVGDLNDNAELLDIYLSKITSYSGFVEGQNDYTIRLDLPNDIDTGDSISVIFQNTNTIETPTITILGFESESLGTYNIINPDGTNIPAGYIVDGQLAMLIFDGASFRLGNVSDTSTKTSLYWTEVSHGFVDGDLLAFDGDHYIKADYANDKLAVGFCQKLDEDSFEIVLQGLVYLPTWRDTSGALLTEGRYYADTSTPGKITKTPNTASAKYIHHVLNVDNTQEGLVVTLSPVLQIASDDAFGLTKVTNGINKSAPDSQKAVSETDLISYASDPTNFPSFVRSDTSDTMDGDLTLNGDLFLQNKVHFDGNDSIYFSDATNSFYFNTDTENNTQANGIIRAGNIYSNGFQVLVAGDENGANASLLDGLDSTQFVRSDQSDTMNGTYSITGGLSVGGSPVWTSGNDGSGSGMHADLLDGLHGSQLLRSDTSDTMNGRLTISYNGETQQLKGFGSSYIGLYPDNSSRRGYIGMTDSNTLRIQNETTGKYLRLESDGKMWYNGTIDSPAMDTDALYLNGYKVTIES